MYFCSTDVGRNSSSGLCQSESIAPNEASNQTCNQEKVGASLEVYPIFLMGQLLLGIGGVPIQPFGISYIDDYSKKRNSPFYLGLINTVHLVLFTVYFHNSATSSTSSAGILFAVTVIGPAFGYIMASFMLRFFVDIHKMSESRIPHVHTFIKGSRM